MLPVIDVMQMKDVFDGDRLIVGPYDWRCCTFVTRFINYPDEYFRQVNLTFNILAVDIANDKIGCAINLFLSRILLNLPIYLWSLQVFRSLWKKLWRLLAWDALTVTQPTVSKY